MEAQPTPPSNSNVSSRLQRTLSESLVSGFIPSSIWKVPFVPHVGQYSGLFKFDDMAQDAYEAATSGLTVDPLEVHGQDVKALAATFSHLLAEAAKEGDFTNILAPERAFNMYVGPFTY